jgi:phage gpG-like protein
MAAVLMAETERQLGLSDHARGTPTPSSPGEPPSLITGQLRRSVIMEPKGPGHVRVGATTVYARIQEFGGDAGKDHASHLPPRPYLRPALLASSKAMRVAALKVIAAALRA